MAQDIEYAIVDIETTGGSPSLGGITEIAIRIHDGIRVIEHWESLIKPDYHIPLSITALTGISNEMVESAPPFAEIASVVFDLLEKRVFVAHNVNFDYSFLKFQFAKHGFDWKPRKLCTVRLSRKFFSGLPSYSLGKLCQRLGIPIYDRHRAVGDVEATVMLFEKILEEDIDVQHLQMLKIASPDQRLPPNLDRKEFEALPEHPGIYYFHDNKGKILYIGKAVNLKKRVYSHFVGNSQSAKRQHFLREIHHISYESCGNELIAMLKECLEIKKFWPKYNRSLKKYEPRFGLYHFVGQGGYDYLVLGKYKPLEQCVRVFSREIDGVNALRNMMEKFNLSPKYCQFGGERRNRASVLPIQNSDHPPIDPELYGDLVQQALRCSEEELPSFVVFDKGREASESSCILMEKGKVYGFGFLKDEELIQNAEELRTYLDPVVANHYMTQLVLNYAAEFPAKVKPLS